MSGDRAVLVKRGLVLNWITITYNALEGIVALVVGLLAGSVTLIGFGVDSVIEVTASGAAQWRLRADLTPDRRERIEGYTSRIIGLCFLGLGAYVLVESTNVLIRRVPPYPTMVGLALLVLSASVMPLLARAKMRVARGLESRALQAEAKQTSLCAYLSVIAVAGVGLNAAFGWWWADPVAALVMTPIIVGEGVAAVRGDPCGACIEEG